MGDFLDTLSFLTPEQRATLRAKDLDTPDAFRHITVERLEAPPYELSTGRAGKLLAAARAADHPSAAAPPHAVTVQLTEPPDISTRVDRALDAAHADPSKTAALLDLGVDQVVLGGDDKIDREATKAMRTHALTAPVGATWQGQRIASTRELSTPPVWCSPRTGKPLQAGKDEVHGTPWAELRLDGLRLAAFGYREDFFEGVSEDIVFIRLRDNVNGVRDKLVARMKAMSVAPESMDERVVYRPRHVAALGRRSPGSPLRDSGQSLIQGLTKLFSDLFSKDELRRFISYLPGGEDVVKSIDGNSHAEYAFNAATVLRSHGMVNRTLKDRLRSERPRRADEIDAVFSAAGI